MPNMNDDSDTGIKEGDWVFIKKGTPIKVIFKPVKLAGRSYKVKVDHFLHDKLGQPAIVRWAATGGVWAETAIENVTRVEAT